MVKTKHLSNKVRRKIIECNKKSKGKPPKGKPPKAKTKRRVTKKRAATLKGGAQKSKRKRIIDQLCNNRTRIISRNNITDNQNNTNLTSEKRIVIIDGANVGFAYANDAYFAPLGVDIAVRFFEKKGHRIKIIIPGVQRNMMCVGDIMERLRDENKLIVSPTKDLPGNTLSSSNDDRFILQEAVKLDAAVISNNNFREFFGVSPDFRRIIESRIIGYAFCKSMFIVPIDPYGRNGPKLEDILNRRIL